MQARQAARQAAARSKARSDTRRAVILVAVAGLLALLGALALITALVGTMRRPLDELVRATGALASGKLDQRVTPAGPRELQDLGEAFNAMGEDLSSARRRIEDERQRLAVTIESLGDALIVTEPGSTNDRRGQPARVRTRPRAGRGRTDRCVGQPAPPARRGARR